MGRNRPATPDRGRIPITSTPPLTAPDPTGELRIILLFDIWRPELTDAEREGISGIFDAIDSFQSLPEA